MNDTVADNIVLAQALEAAVLFHSGQFDRTGNPFALHVIRVSMKQQSLVGQIVGLLHDAIEKGGARADKICEQFGSEVGEAVQLLTHIKPMPYMEYIKALSKNRLASMVKLSDIEDNADVRRMDARASAKFPLYQEAHEFLCACWNIDRKLMIAPN